MSHIYTAIHIAKPPDELYDFVTTPSNWPQWHPSSLQVTGASTTFLHAQRQMIQRSLFVSNRSLIFSG